MNRIGSLAFAATTTALTGAGVVWAAGGSIFGLDTVIDTATAPIQTVGNQALVRASFRSEAAPASEAGAQPATTEAPAAAPRWVALLGSGEEETAVPLPSEPPQSQEPAPPATPPASPAAAPSPTAAPQPKPSATPPAAPTFTSEAAPSPVPVANQPRVAAAEPPPAQSIPAASPPAAAPSPAAAGGWHDDDDDDRGEEEDEEEDEEEHEHEDEDEDEDEDEEDEDHD